MAKYYMAFETMRNFTSKLVSPKSNSQQLEGGEEGDGQSLPELFSLLCASKEIQDGIQLRQALFLCIWIAHNSQLENSESSSYTSNFECL